MSCSARLAFALMPLCALPAQAQPIDSPLAPAAPRARAAAGATVAEAGYVEPMRRQQQGWSYLRP